MQAPSAMLNRLLARGKFRHIQGLLYLAELGRAAHRLGVWAAESPCRVDVKGR